MRKNITLTDKLLAGALLLSVATTALHTTLPAVICTTVHIAVTVIASAIHIGNVKTTGEKQAVPAQTEG